MEITTFILRLFSALLLGACIGLERQIKQRSAGLTTNALVSVGACVFILISEIIAQRGNYDNLRVVGQIVTGIGFLGAGVIMRDGFTIHGLNTAATIWCSAAVGSLCGFGFYSGAAIATFAIIATHLCLKPLSDYFDRRSIKSIEIKNIGFSLSIVTSTEHELKVRRFLVDTLAKYDNIQLQKMKTSPNEEKNIVEITADILSYDKINHTSKQVLADFSENAYVIEISSETLIQRTEK